MIFYSLEFKRTLTCLDDEELMELKIDFRPNYEALFPFLDKYIDKCRILIRLTQEDIENLLKTKDIQKFIDYEKKDHIVFSLPPFNLVFNEYIANFITICREYEIDFLTREAIYCGDILWNYISLGVSDVYITGELAFSLKDIADDLHELGVFIRVIPDCVQNASTSPGKENDFYIRPEDIDLYDGIIDIIEFTIDKENPDREYIIYDIYRKNKAWHRDLNEIIKGFNNVIPNSSISEHFGQIRLNCGKKCVRGGKCRLCFSAIHLSKTIDDLGYVLKKNIDFTPNDDIDNE